MLTIFFARSDKRVNHERPCLHVSRITSVLELLLLSAIAAAWWSLLHADTTSHR